MTYKTIIAGRLEFGTSRSFENAVKLFEHRAENYYRSDILLKREDVFDEISFALNIPRFITQASEKSWRNTVDLLEYLAQYAIAGDLSAWMVEEGAVLMYRLIEPTGDKAAVQEYLKGRELIQESGKENEAKEALSRAIEKFERHALAYERRGYVNFVLYNYDDAIYDYGKSISFNPSKADPYFGIAQVRMAKEEWKAAIADLDEAIKRSIPLQSIYWQARRLKAECHLHLKEYKAAALELKLFTKRTFKPGSSNFRLRKKALFQYGRSLFELSDHKEAVNAFNQAAAIESGEGAPSDAELLLWRGLALQKAGQTGFVNDWRAAADKGSERAARLLEEVV